MTTGNCSFVICSGVVRYKYLVGEGRHKLTILNKYYTVIKHDEHFRTRGKCRKHEPQVSVFYISRVFSNVCSVLSQCNTRFSLLHMF